MTKLIENNKKAAQQLKESLTGVVVAPYQTPVESVGELIKEQKEGAHTQTKNRKKK